MRLPVLLFGAMIVRLIFSVTTPIRVVRYQSSTCYYLENGHLKQYAHPGD